MKAMRDQFVHCRLAGLKAAQACIMYIPGDQLTTKVMPQACTLLLDRSSEIRELSLALVEQSLAVMREHHGALCSAEYEKKTASSNGAAVTTDDKGSSIAALTSITSNLAGGVVSGTLGWSSWGVSLTKSLERATSSGSMESSTNGVHNGTSADDSQKSANEAIVTGDAASYKPEHSIDKSLKSMKISGGHITSSSDKKGSNVTGDGWGDGDWGGGEIDAEFIPDVDADAGFSGSSWADDDEINFDDDDDNEGPTSKLAETLRNSSIDSKSPKKSDGVSSTSVSKIKKKVVAPSVKLSVAAGENWEDF